MIPDLPQIFFGNLRILQRIIFGFNQFNGRIILRYFKTVLKQAVYPVGIYGKYQPDRLLHFILPQAVRIIQLSYMKILMYYIFSFHNDHGGFIFKTAVNFALCIIHTDFLLDSSVGIHFKGKASGSHPSVEGGYVFTGSQKII